MSPTNRSLNIYSTISFADLDFQQVAIVDGLVTGSVYRLQVTETRVLEICDPRSATSRSKHVGYFYVERDQARPGIRLNEGRISPNGQAFEILECPLQATLAIA